MPGDNRSNDLVHWQTQLVTRDAASQAQGLHQARVRFVSPGVVAVTRARLGFREGFLIQDPDGHAIQVVEK